MTYSKSSKRERGLIQNPAREREDLFKIQQERERERTCSKSSKRERGSKRGRSGRERNPLRRERERGLCVGVCFDALSRVRPREELEML